MLVICLATYNGEDFLEELLDSISRQSLQDWMLIASDDASSDATPEILRRWSQTDARMHLLPDLPQNIGVIANFGRLAEAAIARDAEHIAFADQDDVWHPFKLKQQTDAMRKLESKNDAQTPLLVHTDSEIVDRDLNRLHASHRQFAAHVPPPPGSDPIDFLLLSNFVTGCTMLVNRSLLRLGTPLPEHVFMHDWWLAQLAAMTGEIGYVSDSTILYRQHGKNEMGASASAFRRAANRIIGGKEAWREDLRRFEQTLVQASELVRRLHDRSPHLKTKELARIREFSRLFELPYSPLQRIRAMRRLGLPKGYLPRLIATYCRVVLRGKAVTTPPGALPARPP